MEITNESEEKNQITSYRSLSTAQFKRKSTIPTDHGGLTSINN